MYSRFFIFVLITMTTSNPAVAMQNRSSIVQATSQEVGGQLDPVVIVRSASELRYQLCRSVDAKGICSDDAKRVVEVAGTIDFRGTEGTSVAAGCFYDKKNPEKALLATVDPQHTCAGMTKQPITFDASGLHPLLIGSNKTLLGAGKSSAILGKGLALRHVKNVVIRNITLKDINPAVIWAGDAIELSDVNHVWIDHDRFAMVGRQMIVAHFGAISDVRITWNEFDGKTPYLANGHYWNILFNSRDTGQVLIAYNWFHDFSGRSPALHMSGNFYIVNNLFEKGKGHALEADQGTTTLMEGNVFSGVDQPIAEGTGKVFAPSDKEATAASSLCQSVSGQECVPNLVSAGADTGGFNAVPGNLTGIRPLSGLKIISPVGVLRLVRPAAGPTSDAPSL